MSYQLSLEKFQGPLDKLLSLIEERELAVTEVSLAKVTDDFLHYLAALMDADKKDPRGSAQMDHGESASRLRLISEFVSVASRLILIKSKVLLPDLALTEEEETQIRELEQRLAFYKAWKAAERGVAGLFAGREKLCGRPYFLSAGSAFYPSPGLTLQALSAALGGVVQSLASFTRERETLEETIIAIEEKIAEVLARLTAENSMSFREVTGKKHIKEVIAFFLAVLHLAREGLVHLEQRGNFSDIMVSDKRQGTVSNGRGTKKNK